MASRDAFEAHYQSNLERFVKDYPGRYLLIDNPCDEHFFRTRWGLNRYINRKYKGILGPSYFVARIPKKVD